MLHKTIHRLPAPLEFILNTPSHHRVHHGIDLPYLDRNHGGVLIIWDRLFGTFTPEQQRPEYGLTRDIGTFNPVIVALKTWGDLLRKAGRSGSIRNAFLYFIKPPGWSHDGSTKTTRELIEDHNRQHPQEPIRP